MLRKILRVFVHTLTVVDKDYLLNKEKVTQQIQVELSQKEKAFSDFFFFAILESIFNFKHLPRKDDRHS